MNELIAEHVTVMVTVAVPQPAGEGEGKPTSSPMTTQIRYVGMTGVRWKRWTSISGCSGCLPATISLPS